MPTGHVPAFPRERLGPRASAVTIRIDFRSVILVIVGVDVGLGGCPDCYPPPGVTSDPGAVQTGVVIRLIEPPRLVWPRAWRSAAAWDWT
jgi:hypothetical protein